MATAVRVEMAMAMAMATWIGLLAVVVVMLALQPSSVLAMRLTEEGHGEGWKSRG